MLQTVSVSTTRREPPPEFPTEAPSALRAELDALNLELKVLHSSSFALRAYVETWVAFVSVSVTVKLVWDWMYTTGKVPVLAIPLALMGLSAGADAIVQKLKQREMSRKEETQLDRQRDLRRMLGVDELTLP